MMPPKKILRSSSGKPLLLQQRKQGRFFKMCGTTTHDSSKPEVPLFTIANKLPKCHLGMLLDKGIIDDTTRYICKPCIDREIDSGRSQETGQVAGPSSCEDKPNYLAMGHDLGAMIAPDIAKLFAEKSCSDIGHVYGYDPKSWLSQRPLGLIQLLSTMCNINPSGEDGKRLTMLCRIIELIYQCKNSKLVLPVSFRQNLLSYTMTNSKQLANVNGTISPGGSYCFLCNWIEKQADEPIHFAHGLAKAVFDNNQKIGRTYKITGDNTIPTSVMTSHLAIQFDVSDKRQSNAELRPDRWMWRNADQTVQMRVISYMTDTEEIFRLTRNAFINECISYIQDERKKRTIDYIDVIAENIKESSLEKVCHECGLKNDPTFRMCRNCGGALIRLPFINWTEKPNEKSMDPYAGFSSVDTFGPPMACIPGEPDFVNPNSFKTIAEVVQNIGRRAGVTQYGSGDRQWLFVECDGLPHVTLRDIMANVWTCTVCSQSVYGKENFSQHCCRTSAGIDGRREFGWVVPVVGLLHLEMNAARSFTSLNWEVFGRSLADTLGFKTPRSQEWLKKGSDHHKHWDFLEIQFVAMALELLVPYVKECASAEKDPTCDGFWEWGDSIVDPNYAYILQMTFTYLHALMMFRNGVRKCNADAIKNAKAKLGNLFFARKHPKYQTILFHDALDSVQMPDELRQIKEKYVTGTRTGNVGHYQGGDALLEEVNKESKSWLKHAGIPTDHQWQRVFRNLGKMNKIKSMAMETCGLRDQGLGKRGSLKTTEKAEVNKVRALFRRSKYLLSPKVSKLHKSLDGKTHLDGNLANFSLQAKQILIENVSSRLRHEKPNSQSVFVTADERERSQAVENMTKDRIREIIFSLIRRLSPDEAVLEEEYFKKKIQPKSKAEYIDFYYQLRNELAQSHASINN